MHRLWRARAPHAGRERLRQRRGGTTAAYAPGGRLVVAQPSSIAPAAQREAHAVAAGTVPLRARIRALAPTAVVAARIVVVLAQPEEPDQPDDQQADVEDAEADHEDPALSGHL